MWRHRYWSTLAQVLDCCLTSPRHYLKQCCFVTRDALWHSRERHCTGHTRSSSCVQSVFRDYTFRRATLLRVPRLYVWCPRKLPLLATSRFGVMQGFEIANLIFFCSIMHYGYFNVLNMLPGFSFLVRKYRKYTINRGRVVYAVYASAGISPLRQ